MKTKIHALLIVLAASLLAGCEKDLEKQVSLEVAPVSKGAFMDGNTLVVQKGFPVLFHLQGDADYVTFWSGETGHEYAKKEMTELPDGSISSVLSCVLSSQYGTVAGNTGTFKVKISDTFGELAGNDKDADLEKVNAHPWTDITDQLSLSYTPSATTAVSFPLEDKYARALTIAFLYQTTNNTIGQCRWEVRELNIVNTDMQTGTVSRIPAVNMGFVPLDAYASGNDAYKVATSNVAGMWNLVRIADQAGTMMGIHASAIGDPVNCDWLISSPINLRTRDLDQGVAIKNITENVSDYTYTYQEPGEYEVVFVARNYNYHHSDEVVRVLQIKVVE